MRTLTATLEAAQRSSAQRPRVRVLVRDKQARFTWIGSQAVAEVQSAMCVTSDGTTIVVAALDTSGKVWVRRVTDAAVLDPTGDPGLGWGHWPSAYTEVCSDALAWDHGDIAVSDNAGTLRIFYVKSDGSEILCRESSDGGVTWGAADTVKALAAGGASYDYNLASAGQDDVFWCFSRSGYRYVYYRAKSGGAWGTEKHLQYLLASGGEFGNCGGLAAVWYGPVSRFGVVAAFWGADLLDGRIVTCQFDPTADPGSEVTQQQRIVPPGLATAGFTPLWPAIIRTPAALGQRFVLTYSDKFTTGRLSWLAPVCIRSRDFQHWSYKIPLGFTTTHEKRFPLCCLSNVVYAHHVNQAYKLDLWYAGNSAMEMAEDQAQVVRYRIYERPGRGELDVELDNRDGRYDGAGVSGEAAEAMRPLAQVIVDHGLMTAAGVERVECRPFYLWTVSRLRQPDANWARVHAVDGWQLFRLWRPDATFVFEGQTLQWCIEEIAARVGYFEVAFDGSDEWDMTVQYLAVAGEHTDWSGRQFIRAWDRWIPLNDPAVAFDQRVSGYTVLQQLLGLVGGMARWGNGDSTEILYCFIPHNQGGSPAADHTYEDGEVLAGQYFSGLAWPTRVRASGDGVAYQDHSVANGLAVGMEFMQLLYSKNWESAAQCQVAVDSALDDADARAAGGWIRTRPNVGLELLDVVVFSDSRAGGGVTGVKRRVNGLLTEYVPLRRVWRQVVYLEGV
jgi:hypothetical protein